MANGFDFANLGQMFGPGIGGTPTGIDALLSEEQRKLLGRNAAMSAAAALLQAGAPSRTPVNLGQALGSALQAGQAGYQQARAGALQDVMLGEKLREGQQARELQQRLTGVFTAPAAALTPAQQALAAPGGQVGPTMQRAEIMQGVEGPTDAQVKAAQYQRAADLLAAAGKADQAKQYQDMAEKINPRDEVVGQPFEVTDSTGKPVMVQQFKSGKLQTMAGFGPKREVVLQNFGGQTVAVNKSALRGGETFQQTLTPSEAGNLAVAQGNLRVAQGNLGLRQQEFARGAYDRVDTQDGMMYVPKVPGAAPIPVMGTGGAQLQTAKEPPADFSKTVKKLSDLEGNLQSYKSEIESGKMAFPTTVQLPFGIGQIPLPTGKDTARIRGKYQSLLMGVKDLYELGALTGPDMGIISEQLTNPASLAGVFTSRDAMKQQIGVLEDMLGRAKENLSSTYKRPLAPASTVGIPAAARPARLVQDPQTGILRYVQE